MGGPDLHLVHCLTRVFPGDVIRLPHEGHLKAEQLQQEKEMLEHLQVTSGPG